MNCPSCKAAIPETSRFCSECGASLPSACPTCGAPNQPGAKFCSSCGTALLPQPTAAAIPSGPRSTAERRQLSVMFCDLVGSTELSARLDPEDLNELIRAYQARAAETIGRYSGFIARYMGDGLLVYFGWPEAGENDAERAVHAALATAQAVAATPVRGETLRVRIGIATGLVVVGDQIGTGESREQTAIGETPNRAARLQALAAPGRIVIDTPTRRQVGELFECRDLGAVPLKGLAEPIEVFEVLAVRDVQSRFEALRPNRRTPLIGRDEELELLLRRWAQAKAGHGRVVLVSGEPGIGKSRLLAAVDERLRGEGPIRLRYFCSPHQQSSPLHPIIGQLEFAASFERDDTAEARLRKLQALLAQSAASAEDAALLADLLSLPTTGLPSLNLSPQRRKEQTFDALIRQTEQLAMQRPVLMLFEDAHWADPSTLELMDLAFARLHDRPVLVVMTFRPEFPAPWTGQAGVTLIALSRLEQAQAAQLAAQITLHQMLPPALLSRIVAQADGVPLFIEELTRAVLESHPPADDAKIVGVPETLQASLMARLDRLPLAKRVAQIGSVIGREFSYGLIRVVSDIVESALREGLEQLVASGLVFRRGEPPDATYVFKHALVQDAANETLLRTRRKVLHGQLAQVFEAHYPDVVERQPELVAHHWTQAGQAAKAASYWLEAGRLAARRSAIIEAVNHLRRGIEVLRGIEDAPERDRLELGLQLALGPASIATQGFTSSQAGDAYRRAQDLAERLGEHQASFVANWGLWHFTSTSKGSGSATQQLVDRLFLAAERLEDVEFRLQAHHAAWQTASGSGDLVTVRSHVSRGLSLYDRDKHGGHALIYGGHDPAVCGYGHGAVALWLLGYPDQARQSACEGLSLAETLAHVPSVAHGLWLHAMTHQLRGDFPTVLQCSERLLLLGAEHGLALYEAIGGILRGAALAGLGEVGKGLPGLAQSMETYVATKPKITIGFYYILFAETELRAGRPQLGLAALDKAAQQFEVHGSTWEPGLLCVRGDLLAATNECLEAESCYRKSLEIARHQQARSFELRAAMGLTRVWRRGGPRSGAEDILGPIYGWFTEGFDTGDLKQAKTLLL